MKFKIEKNLRIINELITYFHKKGNSDVHIDFKMENNQSLFTVSGKINTLSDKSLGSLANTLNTPRQREVEEYYWHLGGESESDSELTLVGMMIDSADIKYVDEILTIELIRTE